MPDTALRPGIGVGLYPERDERQPDSSARPFGGIKDLIRRMPAPERRLPQVVSRVDRAGRALKTLDDGALREWTLTLRRRLRAQGLGQACIAEAFALVREIAHRSIGMRHFDVQVYAGWAMIHGMIAEMETGEGKTLTATLPACTAALAGIPVHIITTNDYLAARDAQRMLPIYRALGLSVGTITERMDPAARRQAYACDVTYCANQQVAFDYLRDRMVLGSTNGRLRLQIEGLYGGRGRLDKLLLRGLCFALVDEADSVLIDDARVPLIISRQQNDAQQIEVFSQALAVARRFKPGEDFLIGPRQQTVRLTPRGQSGVAVLGQSLGGVWMRVRQREELVVQALIAAHLFKRDQHYLVRDGKVQIIDENTGRVMPDRAWERGLHQLIEIKEGCRPSKPREPLAQITYQRFFRRYLKLGGMTGTAREVARELRSVYHLRVLRIPRRCQSRRIQYPTQVFLQRAAKWDAVIHAVKALHRTGRPVLVGTRAVADSEYLSERLASQRLPHRVLNARQDAEEAEIIAQAGGRGRITVVTNIAGRGTDIPLEAGIAEYGGMHVIATELNDARRIDRQLFGRCARQGDPGSVQAILSLEDTLAIKYYPARLLALLARFVSVAQPLPAWIGKLILRVPQSSLERRHRRVRQELLARDGQLQAMLSFTGGTE